MVALALHGVPAPSHPLDSADVHLDMVCYISLKIKSSHCKMSPPLFDDRTPPQGSRPPPPPPRPLSPPHPPLGSAADLQRNSLIMWDLLGLQMTTHIFTAHAEGRKLRRMLARQTGMLAKKV